VLNGFFHGVNTGSNPVGDANKRKELANNPAMYESSLPIAIRSWYYRGVENDAQWLALSMRAKLLYEVGQKTLPAGHSALNIADPVARGASLLGSKWGWFIAFVPRFGTEWAQTFPTGPTPFCFGILRRF